MGGTGACPLVGGPDSYPSGGGVGALSLDEIRGSCVPEGSLGSLFTDGWGCDPPGIVDCCLAWGFSAAEGWGQIFPKLPPPEKGMLMDIPKSFASNALPPQQATFAPVFPGGPPRTAVRFDSDSYGDFALPWDPVHVKFHVCLLRMVSPFPPVLWSSCTQAPLAFNARCSVGSFPQYQIPRPGDLTWGSELSLL